MISELYQHCVGAFLAAPLSFSLLVAFFFATCIALAISADFFFALLVFFFNLQWLAFTVIVRVRAWHVHLMLQGLMSLFWRSKSRLRKRREASIFFSRAQRTAAAHSGFFLCYSDTAHSFVFLERLTCFLEIKHVDGLQMSTPDTLHGSGKPELAIVTCFLTSVG